MNDLKILHILNYIEIFLKNKIYISYKKTYNPQAASSEVVT